MKRQIKDIKDIQFIVDNFYGKVREDKLIGPIFDNIIQDRWPEHLEKMYRFWQTVLLDERTYKGAPFTPHANLPVNKEHFNRWLHLFKETIQENFEGKIADEALWRANKMAEMFLFKINYYRESSATPIQ